MQILNNLLLDTENLLQTVSADIPENGLNTSSDAGLEGGFADYLDNQLTSFSLIENQTEVANTEAIFPIHSLNGQELPLFDSALLPLGGSQINKLSTDSQSLQTNLVNNIDAVSSQGSLSLFENKSLIKTTELPIDENLFNKESTGIKESVVDKIDKNNLLDLSKPTNNMKLEEVDFFDSEKNIDSNILLTKYQSTLISENISDLNTTDKSLIGFNKISHADSIFRENLLLNSKEIHTVVADENFSESLSEKIDLLIRNNQKEAKISLDPAGLGKIDVQIKMTNNEYVVNIFTQNEGAQQVLDQHSAKLKQLFNNEEMTFNLSQENNSDQKNANSQNNEAKQTNESIGINSHQALKNDINNSIGGLIGSDYLTQESVNLYI